MIFVNYRRFCLSTPLYWRCRPSRVSKTIDLEEIYRLVSKIIHFVACGSVLSRFGGSGRYVLEIVLKFYRNSTKNPIEILSKFYRISIEFLAKFYRNSIEILSKFYRTSIEILLKFYRNSTEILSKFYRNSPGLVPRAC